MELLGGSCRGLRPRAGGAPLTPGDGEPRLLWRERSVCRAATRGSGTRTRFRSARHQRRAPEQSLAGAPKARSPRYWLQHKRRSSTCPFTPKGLLPTCQLALAPLPRLIGGPLWGPQRVPVPRRLPRGPRGESHEGGASCALMTRMPRSMGGAKRVTPPVCQASGRTCTWVDQADRGLPMARRGRTTSPVLQGKAQRTPMVRRAYQAPLLPEGKILVVCRASPTRGLWLPALESKGLVVHRVRLARGLSLPALDRI